MMLAHLKNEVNENTAKREKVQPKKMKFELCEGLLSNIKTIKGPSKQAINSTMISLSAYPTEYQSPVQDLHGAVGFRRSDLNLM
jgi:hypothetical protein